MSLSQMVKATFLAEVDSRNIRYEGLPTAALVLVDGAPGAYSELFIAANAPAADYWVCGYQAAVFGCAADVSFLICLGYGGLDGAAVAPTTLILTQYPAPIIAAQAIALGPNYSPIHWFPYPIKVPGGNRMAARIDNAPTGADNIDEFRVILATVVGEGS